MFTYKNRNELFTITSLEYSHNEGYKTIGVYAEGIGFDLLEVFMERPEDNGSSSGGGNDSDGDGDDNTDDEYADPDDVYIDENGNIIYDKYGQDDYADPDNVSIDGDGNIIYRRSKNNKKNDSLEFKNISYPRFLSIVLKGTGWSYIAQPGLESVKHDITVKYDRNIYAVLQDSMQSYRGVELEFVHELVGGRVQKVIKAYKDGGRGSFVGKRFEYGTNVRGITKTQEVANSEDDTVLYVDNVGIDVRYDVDFALKSAEVPEIEIGDTHYVIDRDFYPPMTIKARIGKIEISFSDPTVNKIYLANNKRISGSAIEDEFDADDVKDMLDDYDFGDDGSGDDGSGDDGGGNDGDDGSGDDGDNVVDECAFWEWGQTDGALYNYLIKAKAEVTFPYGIFFDKTVPSKERLRHQINEVLTITTENISYRTQVAWSDISLKENVRYLDASAMPVMYSNDGTNVYKENLETRDYSSEDLLERADLYDFIVNQVNLCEYNFIGNDVKQIGFVANEYEDTKVGDRLFSRDEKEDTLTYNTNNLLFSTIGALQEEVRIKDEKIASLENRLAAIEKLLGIDNND
jgi:hypothetical protein